MKNIGKPCAGKPHARFDEGALRRQVPGTRSSRVRRGVCKRAKEPAESVPYSLPPALNTVLFMDGLPQTIRLISVLCPGALGRVELG